MKNGLYIKPGIIIPDYELEISASRASGPGGQHVNKTNSRITVRWQVTNSHALTPQLKDRLVKKLGSQISAEGFLIVHHSRSRSQQQNKEAALATLAQIIRNGVHVPKKRIATKISAATHETRLQKKAQRSSIKKLRQKKISFND